MTGREEWTRRIFSMLMMSLVVGCSSPRRPVAGPYEQAYDEIHIISYSVPGSAGRQVRQLPPSAYKGNWFSRPRRIPGRSARPVPKVSPELIQFVLSHPPNTLVRVFITFKGNVRVPRFPRPTSDAPKTDSTNVIAALAAADSVDSLRSRRSNQYAADTASFAGFQARVLRTHWLIQACLVEMPAGQVLSLSAEPSIRHMRLNRGSSPPSHDTRLNDMDKAWGAMNTEHYFDLGYKFGWVALLDTGVLTTHQLLCNPCRLCAVLDCFKGDCEPTGNLNCSSFGPDCATLRSGDSGPSGHGTASAAILTGNGSVGTAQTGETPFRGATEAVVDCFNVYDLERDLDVSAAVKGFELGVARLNDIIVAEMAETSLPNIADVGEAAENAYQAGRVVIAAAGNYSTQRTGQPAQGRHVIGVGVYDVTNDTPVDESWGTEDTRTKPEILGPSYTETASNGSNTDLSDYGGTSGATPYVAAAAVVLRDWLSDNGWTTVDPGEVYAHLILGGDRSGPFYESDHFGAGKLRLPVGGVSWSTKVSLPADKNSVDVPVEITQPNLSRISAAIWWPHTSSSTADENNIELEIRAPGWNSPLKAESKSLHSVFERATWLETAGLSGTWTVRISWGSMVYAPQDVYLAVALTPP